MFLGLSTGLTNSLTSGSGGSPDNTAPVIDLNGAGGGINASGTFTEGDAFTSYLSSATLTDADSDPLVSLVMTCGGQWGDDGLDEQIKFDTWVTDADTDFTDTLVVGATTFSLAFVSATGILTVTKSGGGTFPAADGQALQRLFQYANAAEPPTTGDRTFSWVANDGTDASTAALLTVTVAVAPTGAPNLSYPGARAGAIGLVTTIDITNSGADGAWAIAGDSPDDEATLNVLGYTLNSSTGQITGTGDAGGTPGTYEFKVTCTNGSGADSASFLFRFHSAYTLVSSGDSFPYYCNTANRLYRLTEDVTVPGSAFAIIASGVSLDLDGHTITYDDAAPIPVTNYSFENVTGSDFDNWDMSSAPDASVYNSTTPSVKIGEGEYAIQFDCPCAEQYAVCDTEITLPANRWYSVTASKTDTLQNGTGATMHVILTGTDNANVHGTTGDTHTGGAQNQYRQYFLETGGSSENYAVSVGVSASAAVPASQAYIDQILVTSTRVYGVAVGAFSNQKMTDSTKYYSDITSYGTANTAWVINGTVTQGQGGGTFCHGVFVNSSTSSVRSWLTVTTNGMSSVPIEAQYGGGSGTELRIEDVTAGYTSPYVFRRAATDGSAIRLANSAGIINRNNVTHSSQTGIYWSNGSCMITNNVIAIQSTHTNGFGIQSFGDTGSTITDNTIDAYTSGNSGRGIQLGGGFALNSNPTVCARNTIVAQELALNKEYGGPVIVGCYGIQMEGKGNCEVYDNDVTVYAEHANSYALRENGNAVGTDHYIHDNVFRAVQVDTSKVAAAISIEEMEPEYLFVFEDNELITNNVVIGNCKNCSTGSVRLTRTTIRASGAVDTWRNLTTSLAGTVDDLELLDTVLADSTAETNWDAGDVRLTNGSADSGSSLVQSWTQTITVDDGVDPIEGAAVSVVDQFDTETATGTTNASGGAAVAVPEFRVDGTTKTTHNPQTLTVSAYGFTNNEQAISPTAPNASLTATMTAGNTPPTAANGTVVTTQNTPYTFAASDFNYDDAESDPMASVKITTLETSGALTLDGVDVTLHQVIAKTDIDGALLVYTPGTDETGEPYTTFGFSVNDGTDDSVATYTMSVDVTAVVPPAVAGSATGQSPAALGTSGSAGNGDCTITHGFTLSSGDLLIALAIQSSGARTITPPAGWATELDGDPPTTPTHYYVFSRVCGSSEPSSYTFVGSDNFAQQAIALVHITGAADPGSVAMVITTAQDLTSGAGPKNCPSVTPTANSSLVLMGIIDMDGAQNFTADATTTKEAESDSNYTTVAVCSFDANASATGTKAWSVSTTWHDAYQLVSIAIAPAS